MADRYDLKTARTGKDGKTYWTKIGVMFPMKERDGFNISLEALPIQQLNDQGQLELRITAWEPYKDDKPKGNGGDQAQQGPPSETKGTPGDELDDEIPF